MTTMQGLSEVVFVFRRNAQAGKSGMFVEIRWEGLVVVT